MNVRFYLSYDIKIALKYQSYCKKTFKFCHYVRNVVIDVITFPENLYTSSGLSILLHDVISLQDATSYYDKCIKNRIGALDLFVCLI